MESVVTHAEHRDDFGAKLGMWIFIFTELLLFGGLFLVYAVYRRLYPADFHDAALELNAFLGTLNTVALLISSMTVAMSLTAVQKGNQKLAARLILVTILMGVFFLFNKYHEWGTEIRDGLYPGSENLMGQAHGVTLFFGLYFFMTGLHMLHMLVGMILLIVTWVKIKSGAINSERYVLLENGSLYWCLVDLIWIFLFPLLYLIP
ncbi:MAG: cytochrome c oxidase subunit 3 [Bacteroidota bacterium]|nr:cytochrome c oxidase subunit 3 [Bacteroidota bacterium]